MTTPMRNPDFIYKICTPEVFAAAEQSGIFTGMPIDERDGYLHFSTASQLPETLRLYFKGEKVMVFAVRSFDMGSKLVWEASRGGALFPHVYGTFPMSAVTWGAWIEVAADGSTDLPKEVV